MTLMTKKAWIGFSIACAALWTTALGAEGKQVGSNATAGLPAARGVYYHAASGWVALPTALLLPFLDSGFKEMIGVGSRSAIAEMPGPHAAIRIIDPRPTFYVRGFSTLSGLYLVRAIEKQDYRELRMSASSRAQRPYFRAKDLNDIELEPVASDLVAVTPRADLKPGEYVVASVLEPGPSHQRHLRYLITALKGP